MPPLAAAASVGARKAEAAEANVQQEQQQQELEDLRERVKELEADKQQLLNQPPTLESLSIAIRDMAKTQFQMAEGQSNLEEMLLLTLGKDTRGRRAPPKESIELAETIVEMEAHGLSTQQVDRAHQMFELYDEDGSGALDPDELVELLRALGTYPSTSKVNELIHEQDTNENGTVTLNEFLHIYEQVVAADDGVTIDGVHDNEGLNLGKISDYGIYAMMRWVHFDDEEINGDVTGPLVPYYRRKCRSLVLRRDAEFIFYLAIWFSAVSSGLNTDPDLEELKWVTRLADVTMVIFAFEVTVKLLCETQSCAAFLGFFGNFWNSFDFFLLISIAILTPILHSADGTTALRCLRILRLVRSLRILRAAKILPKLMLVLETLVASITSVGYIVLFMLLTSYIFAIVAVTFFGRNDPFHFGDLGSAMLSLFRIATQEDWTDIMYYNMYGCDGWGDYVKAVAVSSADCEPEGYFFGAPMFFVTYVTVTTFLLLNLFIGVIVNNMMETKALAEKKKAEAKAWAVATRLKMNTKFLSDGAGGMAKGVATDLSGMVRDGSKLGVKIFGNAKKKSKAMVAKGNKEADGAEVEFGEKVVNKFDNPVADTK